MHGKYLRKIQLPYLHFLLQFDHNSCEATAIVAESENASTATEPDDGQSETNAETERTETTEVITEDSTETPAPVEVSGSTENSTILPLSYEDFNVNGFGYSNYVDLYGAGNGYEDVERISIMTTNCTAYTEYPDQISSDTETSRGIKLGDSREQVIAAYGESRNEVVYKSKAYNHDGLESQYNLCYSYLDERYPEVFFKVSNHQFNWWFAISPPKGYITARPKGRCHKHFYWSAIKRYFVNLLFSILLLVLLYTSVLPRL